MLMRANDRRIEHEGRQVGSLQGAEDFLPDPCFGPAIEPLKHGIPTSEPRRQIAPWCAGASDPDHGIYEQPIVLAVPAGVALPTRQQAFDLTPFLVRQFVASTHGLASLPQ